MRTAPASIQNAAQYGPWISVAKWLAIAAGGAMGALLRFALALMAADSGWSPLLATWVANLLGSLALGFVIGRFLRADSHPLLRPFWVLGFFGSFTTFSTLALETLLTFEGPRAWLGPTYLAGSIAFGLVCFVLGRQAGERLAGAGSEVPERD